MHLALNFELEHCTESDPHLGRRAWPGCGRGRGGRRWPGRGWTWCLRSGRRRRRSAGDPKPRWTGETECLSPPGPKNFNNKNSGNVKLTKDQTSESIISQQLANSKENASDLDNEPCRGVGSRDNFWKLKINTFFIDLHSHTYIYPATAAKIWLDMN